MGSVTCMSIKVLMTAVGLTALSTAAPMGRPECGNKQTGRVKRWTQLGTVIWPLDFMPLTISIANTPTGFSTADIKNIALQCANMWAAGTNLRFQQDLVNPKGNIAISFEHIDGPIRKKYISSTQFKVLGGTVGTGLSPVKYGDKSSYLKLDEDEKWKKNKDAPGEGVSLKWAICHEMGHNLGLGHSTDPRAIMYGSNQGQDENTLYSDDRNGIVALYGAGDTQITPAPRRTPSPRVRTTGRQPILTRRMPHTRATQRPFRRNTAHMYTNYPPQGHVPRYRPQSPSGRGWRWNPAPVGHVYHYRNSGK